MAQKHNDSSSSTNKTEKNHDFDLTNNRKKKAEVNVRDMKYIYKTHPHPGTRHSGSFNLAKCTCTTFAQVP